MKLLKSQFHMFQSVSYVSYKRAFRPTFEPWTSKIPVYCGLSRQSSLSLASWPFFVSSTFLMFTIQLPIPPRIFPLIWISTVFQHQSSTWPSLFKFKWGFSWQYLARPEVITHFQGNLRENELQRSPMPTLLDKQELWPLEEWQLGTRWAHYDQTVGKFITHSHWPHEELSEWAWQDRVRCLALWP